MRSHVADQLRNKLCYINYANVKKFLAIQTRPPDPGHPKQQIELNRVLEIGPISERKCDIIKGSQIIG